MSSRLLSIDDFVQRVPLGRTRVYEMLGSGELTAKKIGRRTFIPETEVDRLIEAAPSATIRTVRRPKRNRAS